MELNPINRQAFHRERPPVWTLAWPPVWISVLALTIGSVLMYVFMLNSGFGYDATQYLIIGEDWRQGVAPYGRYVEVKPPGVFFLAAMAMRLFGNTVYGLHLAALTMNLILVLATTLFCRRWLSWRGSLAAGAAVLGMGFLTEMYYFLTEQPLAVFGLIGAAFVSAARRGTPKWTYAFLAGLSLGTSLLFKAVAVFYLAAAVVILLSDVHNGRPRLELDQARLVRVINCFAGFSIPIGLAIFWAHGQGVLKQMLLLSFWVPMVEYPTHFAFLKPLVVKLGVLLICWAGMLWFWFRRNPSTGSEIAARQWATIVFSVFALTPLVKSQASHYVIAALPFMVAFAVSVLPQILLGMPARARRLLAVAVIACSCFAVVFYREKLNSKLRVPNLSGEQRFAEFIVSLTKPGENALFLNGVSKSSSYLYLITGLRPPASWPFLAIDLYSYCPSVRKEGRLVAAMNDERTGLVGWVPEGPIFYLPWGLPFHSEEIEAAKRVLLERFEPVAEVDGKPVAGLWRKKGRVSQARALPGGPYAVRR